MDSRILFLLAAAVLWVILYAASRVLPLERYGVEMSPLLLAVKTRRLNDWIDRTARSRPRLWRALATLGALAAGGLCAGAFYFLSWNLYAFFYAPGEAGAVAPFIPGLTVGLELLAYILIPLIIVMFSHEVSHGIAARIEGIPIKSAGLVWAFVLFGAFVEPDEESFKRSSWRPRVKVLSSGSAANLAVALGAFLLMQAAFQGPSGVIVAKVAPGGPADQAGVKAWDVVIALNDMTFTELKTLAKTLKGLGDNTTVSVVTNRGAFPTMVSQSQRNGIGATFYVLPYFMPRGMGFVNAQAVFYVFGFISAVFSLNLAVGMLNMLPLYPFDGEGYVNGLLEGLGLSGLLRKGLRYLINALAAALLFSNIALTVTRIGFYLTIEA